MNSRVLSYVSVVVCLILGSLLIALRYHTRQTARLAEEESVWSLTYALDFEPVEKGASLNIYIPYETPYTEVLVGKLPAQLGIRPEHRGNVIVATAAQPGGPFKINAEFELRLSPRSDVSRADAMEYLSPDARARYLRADLDNSIPSDSDAVRAVAQNAQDAGETVAERVQWIFRTCSNIPTGTTDDPSLILSQVDTNASALGRARTMVALSRAADIPARLVTGFEIKQTAKATPLVWVEVFMEQSWVPFDPTTGFTRVLPMNIVPVRRGGDQPYRPDPRSSKVTAEYSIVRVEPPLAVLRSGQRHPIQVLDLSRLPIPMHQVLRVLLLLPFGALITTIIRNVVGIGTFGTFSPALLAMSFIYANWQTGVAILIIVIMAGVVSRSYLERLRLLAVPRLSIMLTIVILCVVFGMSILYYLLPEVVTDAVLLPMVILTMLIERFYVTTEEDGMMYTVKLAAGTLLVASLVYAILAWNEVGQFVLIYPESHLYTIAIFIVLGRYAGYRITELWRFRDLVTHSENTP
jgi:hypothetical protein